MKDENKLSKGTIVYLPHGGGPFPVLGGMGHDRLISFLKGLSSILPVHDEILVISAHWEERIPTIITSGEPKLLYDYYGFQQAAYEIEYPAPGAPELAAKVIELLNKNGIKARGDSNRGLDHGVFIPLKVIYPKADIPVTQLSLKKKLNAAEHVRIGEALQELMSRNILIIGSGFSFHNMRAFSLDENAPADPDNDAFQDWLIETCCETEEQEVRAHRLANWTEAPFARYCNPREEHLLPLHVCQGIAGRNGKVIFDDYIVGKRGIALKW
ncbi:MAG: class III extradiol ring-cleavage dioxygenase [Spirochaetales bacterium]|uniref:Class III extradiol ring-cleavage dioxygenase n=1 Tax=Candidatus Thalassospirochaeta sargassi TaxID=3119039 RepID=A0AAJ1ML55_9SPIO|nr:class III extradiol ring-cleavage dioxygenase [Spirochaetales bacterium]